MEKRYISVILTVILLFSLCACQTENPSFGSEPIEDTSTVTETQETLPPVTDPSETETEETQPEDRTPSLLDFLKIAAQPVGKTMYVWAGGWNEEDTAAGIEALTIGVSPRWEKFAAQQTADYDHNAYRFQIHDGLDCSGYVGWAVYNVLAPEADSRGYVMSSTIMAEEFSNMGLGEFTAAGDVTDWKPGDIMSMNGHVWIAVAQCEDGSVLLVHSSPPGVSFCGTALADGSKSQAVLLAEEIMSEHYPDWYERFPNCQRPYSYLTTASSMRWSREVLSDEEGIYFMSADEIVAAIFG